MGFSAIFAALRNPGFAIGALGSFGAYAGWVANRQSGWHPQAALLVAFAVAALTGTLVGWVSFRPPDGRDAGGVGFPARSNTGRSMRAVGSAGGRVLTL